MHNRAGALGETVHVYGHAAQMALAAGARDFVSVGLGAGYVELVLLSLAKKAGLSTGCFTLRSFEANPTLLSAFIQWIEWGQTDVFGAFLDSVLSTVAHHFCLSPRTLREFAKEVFEADNWTLEPPLTAHTPWPFRTDCIFFDAFSKQTNPELWDAGFLEKWLMDCANGRCSFASYASNKPLQRVLQSSGFVVTLRPGFGGKRECTYAQRLG